MPQPIELDACSNLVLFMPAVSAFVLVIINARMQPSIASNSCQVIDDSKFCGIGIRNISRFMLNSSTEGRIERGTTKDDRAKRSIMEDTELVAFTKGFELNDNLSRLLIRIANILLL